MRSKVKRRHLNNQLLEAIWQKDIDTAEALLSQGASIEAQDREHQQTPLMFAAQRGSRQVTEWILNHGADINKKDAFGKTALGYAIQDLPMLQLLISRGADIHAVDAEGRTLLMRAVQTANIEIVKYVIDQGAEMNARDHEGESALMRARAYGFGAIARLLEEAGAEESEVEEFK